jgi:hypothetical protein
MSLQHFQKTSLAVVFKMEGGRQNWQADRKEDSMKDCARLQQHT